MKLSCTTGQSGRQFVLLAPNRSASAQFDQASCDSWHHNQLLTAVQRLRGRTYVADGAIQQSDLSADGRHIQEADDLSWHLLTLDGNGEVLACIRYHAHQPTVKFSELSVAASGIARSSQLGPKVRAAIEAQLDCARERGIWYVELGGWALSESLRCSTEAIRTLLTVYALSQVHGGALGLSTATTRHHSSSILRRIGGRTLRSNGAEIPSYHDPHYNCEMELLSFDSQAPNARYSVWIDDCRQMLHQVPVIVCAPPVAMHAPAVFAPKNAYASSLINLNAAMSERFTHQPVLAEAQR
jgi:hypothetical protein